MPSKALKKLTWCQGNGTECLVGDKGAAKLAEALKHNTSLTKLNMVGMFTYTTSLMNQVQEEQS